MKLFVSSLLFFIMVAIISQAVIDDAYNQSIALEIEGKESSVTEVDFSLFYDFHILKKSPNIILTVNVPKSIPDKQKILKIEFSQQPTHLFNKNGNDYAEYVLNNQKEDVHIEIRIKAEIYKYDLYTASKRENNEKEKQSELNKYLVNERMIEKGHPVIKKIAKRIDGKNEVKIVENIYNYVIENMEPDVSRDKGRGALKAATTKKGMCIDYCDLFVAICRAQKIPARVTAGYKTDYKASPKHSWAEVYLADLGWVPLDLTYGVSVPSEIRHERFRSLKPMYIYFTNIRNDELLHNCYIHYFEYRGGDVEADLSVEFRKPMEKIYKGS